MRVPARRVRRWRGVVLVASAVMLAAACGPTTPVPTPGPQLGSAAPSSNPGPSGAARPPASAGAPTPRPSGPPSSSSLIAAAEAAGTLDHDTALLYQLYSALDYASLPAAYQSDSPAAPDATRILAELRMRSAQLSPDLQARVAPFFLRPSDPGSVWARRTRSGSRPESVALAAYTADDCPDNHSESHCIDAASTPVRIWFSAYESLDETAAALAREIDRSAMWAKERTAMVGHVPCTDAANSPGRDNGGDGRLDIYLVPTATGSTGLDFSGRRDRGVTLRLPNGSTANGVTVVDGTDACGAIPFIVLNASRSAEDLAGTTAHELFHAFQFSFANALEFNRSWWAEASATWARDLVYPETNDEQSYLDGYWSRAPGPEGPLDRFAYGDGAPYAAYLWAFYLRQKLASTDGSIVGRLWKASETEDPIHVMEALDGWAQKFKEFALWNWNNDDPRLNAYKDEPDAAIPSTVLTQLTACMTSDGCEAPDGSSRSIIAVGTHTVPVDARYTSVQYLAAVPEVDVEALRFDLGGVRGKAGLGIQAIIWIGNAPSNIKVEDWSNLPERRFCLASEDVRKLVLVISNSAVDPVGDVTGSITADATANGCPATTTSTATFTKDATTANSHIWSKLTMVVVSSEGKTKATVDYQWDYVENTTSAVIRGSERGSGTVDAYLGCSIAADGTLTVETSWTDNIPATQSRTYNGVGTPEQTFLEFNGFMFKARADPTKPGTAGTKTEDDSSGDSVDVAVYTWDCPTPDRGP